MSPGLPRTGTCTTEPPLRHGELARAAWRFPALAVSMWNAPFCCLCRETEWDGGFRNFGQPPQLYLCVPPGRIRIVLADGASNPIIQGARETVKVDGITSFLPKQTPTDLYKHCAETTSVSCYACILGGPRVP